MYIGMSCSGRVEDRPLEKTTSGMIVQVLNGSSILNKTRIMMRLIRKVTNGRSWIIGKGGGMLQECEVERSNEW